MDVKKDNSKDEAYDVGTASDRFVKNSRHSDKMLTSRLHNESRGVWSIPECRVVSGQTR
jgi:hypothetical protein